MTRAADIGWLRTVLLGLLLAAAVLAVYAPVLGQPLLGDDYQWLQHTHHAVHRPLLLLADLDTFYRPANTWSLAVDHLAWGWEPVGFRVSSLLLHALTALLLAGAGRRLGLPGPVAAAVALVWATSVFAFDPAAQVSMRFENLLLSGWLILILAWPRQGEEMGRARLGVVVAGLALAAVSKETWVVSPLLVLALEFADRPRRAGRDLLRAPLVVTAAAGLYVVLYFAAFPGDKSYFAPSPSTLAKVPQQLAAFLHLEPLQHAAFTLNVRGVAASLAVIAAIAVALRRRRPAGCVGAALLLAPALPTLMVPYLPTRYTAIPYAGFLLLAADLGVLAATRLGGTGRRLVAPAAALATAAMVAGGAAAVRSELVDLERVGAAHLQLLAEARVALAEFPSDRPVLVVRDERVSPLHAVADAPAGLPKLLFVRGSDPYGLIDTAALFEFVLARPGTAVERLRPAAARGPAALLLHRRGGFVWGGEPVDDVVATAEAWRARGRPVRVVQVEPLDL